MMRLCSRLRDQLEPSLSRPGGEMQTSDAPAPTLTPSPGEPCRGGDRTASMGKGPRMTKPRLAVLLSGGGTTLQNLLDRIADGRLDAEVAHVVSSKANAVGLERARRANVPATVVERKT